jgi:hypothetical protein
MRLVQKAFAPLAALPCWGVKRGHGTFLTFEFGDPVLEIREPITPKEATSKEVLRLLRRRLAYPKGQWHLWVYCCAWSVREGTREVGDWSSNARIDRAAAFLNGQKLTTVNFNSRGARTTFIFDLGGSLETRPYDRRGEQWLLYEPSGKVLVWRADRQYSHNLGTRPSIWRRAG